MQIDGSPHDWFEGRGLRCTLIVFIDDDASELMALRFAPTETTQTLQDRLVKELRLTGISDIDAANAFLPGFLSDYNLCFAVPPQNPTDAHRPVLCQATVCEAFDGSMTVLYKGCLTASLAKANRPSPWTMRKASTPPSSRPRPSNSTARLASLRLTIHGNGVSPPLLLPQPDAQKGTF